MMDPRVAMLFRDYEQAFSSLDVLKSASYFDDPVISAGPKGSAVRTRSELIQASEEIADYYRNLGHISCQILDIAEFPVSEQYTLVMVEWEATMMKDEELKLRFKVSYLVRMDIMDPKIIAFIAHEDDEDLHRNLGLGEG